MPGANSGNFDLHREEYDHEMPATLGQLLRLGRHGLRMRLVWLHSYVDIGPDTVTYDPGLHDAVALLRGREVLLSLTIRGGKRSDPSYDDRVVPVLREIADSAATTGQRVVLYPHVGDWVERIGDAVRVARKVDRPNLGAMFNLCHWLRVEYPDSLEEALDLRKDPRPLFTNCRTCVRATVRS
ncbi:MAG: hypothetical protein EA424_19935 [Planctomycetaceae bacterium]|nr:MAG: hypothetical protein EA424_19935 [Planctomycetaceae bacterium]